MSITAEYPHVSGLVPRVARIPQALIAVGLASGLTLAVALAPSTATVTLWVLGMVALVVALGSLNETYTVEQGVLHHRSWVRTVSIRLTDIVQVDRGDADSLSREVLFTDRRGQVVSVPVSVLHRSEELSNALRPLMN